MDGDDPIAGARDWRCSMNVNVRLGIFWGQARRG
jgi:hypothetical protein